MVDHKLVLDLIEQYDECCVRIESLCRSIRSIFTSQAEADTLSLLHDNTGIISDIETRHSLFDIPMLSMPILIRANDSLVNLMRPNMNRLCEPTQHLFNYSVRRDRSCSTNQRVCISNTFPDADQQYETVNVSRISFGYPLGDSDEFGCGQYYAPPNDPFSLFMFHASIFLDPSPNHFFVDIVNNIAKNISLPGTCLGRSIASRSSEIKSVFNGMKDPVNAIVPVGLDLVRNMIIYGILFTRDYMVRCQVGNVYYTLSFGRSASNLNSIVFNLNTRRSDCQQTTDCSYPSTIVISTRYPDVVPTCVSNSKEFECAQSFIQSVIVPVGDTLRQLSHFIDAALFNIHETEKIVNLERDTLLSAILMYKLISQA